jgi:hypothetical protein
MVRTMLVVHGAARRGSAGTAGGYRSGSVLSRAAIVT